MDQVRLLEPVTTNEDTNCTTSEAADELELQAQEQGGSTQPQGRGTNNHYKLFTSHFLSTWNARQYEFAVTLLLLEIFPDTLLWTGVFGFCTTTAGILLSPYVGTLVNQTGRLRAIQLTILLQRSAVCCACLALLSMTYVRAKYNWIGFIPLVAFSIIERLCAVGNTVAIERDWVVVIAETTNTGLGELNASMRRIDLFCALVSPMLTSWFLTLLSTRAAILGILFSSIISPGLEYYLILRVYLETPKLSNNSRLTRGNERSRSVLGHPDESSLVHCFRVYGRSAIFLPSLALSFLYLTVLSFGAPMVGYLKLEGYSDVMIAAMRSLSVLTGLLATFAAPRAIIRVGLERSGLWSLWSQTMCLIPVLFTFYGYLSQRPFVKLIYLFGFLSLSRLGLWGYDLTAQELVQEEVPEEDRGLVSGCEQSVKNFFELLTWIFVVIFHDAGQFYILATISVCSVLSAALLYSIWCRQRRGHLLHVRSALEKVDCCR